MDDEWGDYADGWDDDEAARAYSRAAFASLRSIADGPELDGARVVDFGCGTGLLTEQLAEAGAAVLALDTSPAMLAVLDAKVTERGWTNVTTSTDLGDVGPGNDLIVCSSVCSFLDDYPATMAHLASLLRPGGLVIQWDWERTDDGHGLARDEIADALAAAGLEAIVVETAFEIDLGTDSDRDTDREDGIGDGAQQRVMRPLVGHGRRPAAG